MPVHLNSVITGLDDRNSGPKGLDRDLLGFIDIQIQVHMYKPGVEKFLPFSKHFFMLEISKNYPSFSKNA
jgi:hypothetical protein